MILAAVVALGISTSACATPRKFYDPTQTFTANKERTVYFKGVIGGSAIKQASRIEALSRVSAANIDFVINSPGGSVLPGLQVISAMRVAKARGVKFRCFVPVLAASMAFQILAECNKRYTLVNTLLLWHPVKISSSEPMDATTLLYYGQDLRRLERPLVADLIRALNISRETFMYHYRHETLWTATQLMELSPNFISIVDNFANITDPFGFGE